MKNRRTNSFVAGTIFYGLLSFTSQAHAADLEAQFRGGLGASDNIGRSASNEISETMATVGFDFGLTEASRYLTADVRSNLDYMHYLDNSFDAEWIGGLNADLAFTLVEDRLRWILVDTFGQRLFDPLQAARPNNREDVNFFTTGPTLDFNPGGRNPIRFDVRYSRIDFEIQPADNGRLSGLMSIGRDISRDTSVSLNFSAERTEFDNSTVTPPVERYVAYLRFQTTGARNALAVDIGFNDVEYAGIQGDGVLFDLSWTRQTSANGALELSFGSRISNEGDVFNAFQQINADLRNEFDGSISTDPFENNYATVLYTLQQERYGITVQGFWSEEIYERTPANDRELARVLVDMRRELTRKLNGGFTLELRRSDFGVLNQRNDDFDIGLGLGIELSRAYELWIDYRHYRRDSTLFDSDITENKAFVRLIYTPAWGR